MFRYRGLEQMRPETADFSRLQLPSSEPEYIEGLHGLLGQAIAMQGSESPVLDGIGGGPTALAEAGPEAMGPVAELKAAETTMELEDENAGWMSRMYDGGGDEAAKAAMSDPWTALAAVVMGNEIFRAGGR